MNYKILLLLPSLVLIVSGIALTTATTEPDDAPNVDNSTASLTITTHNPACTAVNLDYLGVTRLTDIQPGYPPANFTSGINVTAVIWTHDANATIPAILRSEVSSVAMYSYVVPNATANATSPGQPDLLRLEVNPDVVIPVFGQSPCDTAAPFLMDTVKPEGAGPGTGPMGLPPGNRTEPEPAGPKGAGDDEPEPLTLDPRPLGLPDPESQIYYYGDLIDVGIRTYGNAATDIWRYLKDNGAIVYRVWPDENTDTIGAYVPPSILWSLSTMDDIRKINPVRSAYTEHYGSTNTEGLLPTVHPNVEQWHGLGHNGTGVRVGVIDQWFNLVTTTGDDLPPQADISCQGGCNGVSYSGTNLAGARAHGMGVAEIVMDMAPGVTLFLTNTTSMVDDLHTAVNWLITQDVDIISMSLRFPFEGPGDGTSPVTNSATSAVNNAVRSGAVWVNSAGNYGESSWLASGTDVQTSRVEISRADPRNPARHITYIDFNTTTGTNITNYVQSGFGPNAQFGTTLDLRWHGGGELHLARFDASGNMIGREATRPYNEGEPAKSLEITRTSGSVGFRIWVNGSTVPDWIQLVSYDYTRLEFDSIDGGVNTPSDSHNAGMLAAGAVVANNTATQFAARYSPLEKPGYSSSGDHPGSQGLQDARAKPDIYGASHVTTDAYWNWLPANSNRNPEVFPGTSAAAPHIAGMAALVMDYHNNTLSPADTADYLKTNMDAGQVAGLPSMGPPPPPTTLHSNPFQQIIIDTADSTVHLGRVDSVYTLAIRWNVDNAYWRATSSNTTVASVVDPNHLSEMRDSHGIWFDGVTINPHNPGTTTITVNVTDNSVHWIKSFDVTVTGNTHPSIVSIGQQHMNITGGAHTITFSANDVDGDVPLWQYVFENHTYFTISAPGTCEAIYELQRCDLPGNTLSVVPEIEGENILLYGARDGRGGTDTDAVDVNVASNTATAHGNVADVTTTSGESVTVQFQATDADGDVIIHLTPRLNDISIAEASIPYHLSNQEALDIRRVTPAPGYTAESVTYENHTVTSMTVLKEAPSGNMLRYVVNGTGGLPALPESVIITNPYERSPTPTTANLTMTITGLSPGNTTISSTVRDVWGGSDTKNFTVTVLSAAPTITLLGSANMTIPLNVTYVEPGYNATDYRGMDLTANVTVTGTVDTATIGTYTLHYDVTDGAGNPATTQNRTIHVASNAPPVADAGPDQLVREGATIQMNGTASDDGLTPLTYVWSQRPAAPAIPFGNATDPATTFVAPSVNHTTTVTLTLTASDGNSTHSDSMNMTILDVPDPDSYFVTTWRTASPNDPITVPVGGHGGTYDVDWGDGTISAGITGDSTHTYAAPGDHTIRISGDFSRIHLGGNTANAAKLVSIDQWGDTQWSSMASAFEGARNVIYGVADAPDLSQVTDMSGMFNGASSFNGNISSWDVSSVTDMSEMFVFANSFNQNISEWDVSSATDISEMFSGALSFNGSISEWDVSSVTDMHLVFAGAASFNQDISEWDVSSATDMSGMFSGATSFNGDISEWDVSSVTDMHLMFSGASSFNQDISGWNVSSADQMTWMFHGASSFRQNLGAWYIIPDSTTISKSDAPGTIGTISSQNIFLDGHSPTYGIGTGGDSALFNITGSDLVLDAVPDRTAYTVNVTSTGTFGTNNHRILQVSVPAPNGPPTADAGPDQTVREGLMVSLVGNATDPDGDALSYLWTHDSPLNITLANATAPSTTFIAPAVHTNTTITFTLTVSDTAADTADSVHITITDGSPAAPRNLRAAPGIFSVDLAWDDPDDGTITGYRILSHIPATQPEPHTLVNDTGSAATSYAIRDLEPGTAYTFRIIAINEYGESGTSDPVSVSTLPNNPPISDAGPDQTVRPGDTITLNGTASHDPDGHTISYAWNQTSGTGVALSGADTGSPTFEAPAVANRTTLAFQLTVSDGRLASSDTVDITIRPDGPPAIVLSGQTSMTIPVGSTYTEPGYTATDDIDGNITVDVTVTGTVDTTTLGTYTIHYDVSDSSGNKATTQSRTIHVTDTTPPAIVLSGQTNMTIQVGSTYTEPGYTATDNYDSNITGSVTITGTVDTTTIDSYTIQYDVSDSSGNKAATQTRTIHVTDDTPPIITLSGQTNMTIPVGSTYTEPGYTATDREDGDLTGSVTVTGTVDVNMIGTYTLHYDVTDSSGNKAATQTRTIHVTDDTPPIITLSGQTNMTIPVGSTYTEPGYTATDNYDGDLAGSVTVTGTVDTTTVGTYTIHYDVSDSSGNKAATQTRTIHVTDDTPPIITLSGQASITIQVGSTYAEPGYTAADNYDGDLTGDVTVTGTVDTTALGTYTIQYDVSDSSGNKAATQTRTIHVTDTTPPVITLAGPGSWLIPFGSTYTEPGYTATDNYDGNITGSVTVTGTVDTSTTGTHTIRYDVSDSSGNAAIQQTRIVNVNAPPPPAAPANLQTSDITTTSATLSWDASTGQVTGYKILYRISAPGSQLGTLVGDTGDTTTYTVQGLEPGTAYAFRVIAIGPGTESQMSGFVRVTTDSPPPPAIPANLQTSNITTTSAILSWDDPADHSITGYKIMYRAPATQPSLGILVANTGNTNTSYAVSGLEPDTAYVFRIIAMNGHGESKMSNPVRITTPGG